jgi:rod shape determining protein RodA
MRLDLARIRSIDWPLFFAVFTLLAFGLAAIYSVALSQPESDFLNVKKQLLAAAVGLVLFFFVARANYRLLRNYNVILYGFGLVLLVAVVFFGHKIRGTTGWFSVGAFSFQPVEFVKLALAVSLAAYFGSRSGERIGLRQILESGAIALVPALLVGLQPDLGSSLLLMGMWAIVLLVAGVRLRWVAALGALGGTLSVIAWNFFFKEYQKARITSFLNPSSDPLGQGYNVKQALIAIGSGGPFGRGLGFGSQSQLKFLPESQTDFVFAVIAEELGFFGVAVVLGAFGLLFYRLLRIASLTRDDFTSFLVVAIGAAVFCQVLVNVGANLGLLPVTGVTLPLVSYGGSSLIFTLLMLGVVESVAAHLRRND